MTKLTLNLSGINDYTGGHQLLDEIYVARELPRWPDATTNSLGWPTSMPSDGSPLKLYWQWGGDPACVGDYVLTYKGTKPVSIGAGDAAVVTKSVPGEIRFTMTRAKNLWIILEQGAGELVRDMHLVRAEHYAAFLAGERWRPEWIDFVKQASEFRFMDWLGVNHGGLSDWSKRPKPPTGRIFRGVPAEWMCDLCNRLKVDAYVNVPHLITGMDVNRMAQTFLDGLNSDRNIKVAYSNESVFNWPFAGARYMAAGSKREWGTADHFDWHVKQATDVAVRWRHVWRNRRSKVKVGLETQTAQPYVTDRLLRAYKWKAFEPAAWKDPKTTFDFLAVTTYFGGNHVRKSAERTALIEEIQNGTKQEVFDYIYADLTDPTFHGSVPSALNLIREHKELLAGTNIELIAYEGGSHVVHSFAVTGYTQAQKDIIGPVLLEFSETEMLADLYEQMWRGWGQITDANFNQHGDVRMGTSSSSFTLIPHLGAETPISRRVADLLRDVDEPVPAGSLEDRVSDLETRVTVLEART